MVAATRLEAFVNPANGEITVRRAEPPDAAVPARPGVAAQQQALGYCPDQSDFTVETLSVPGCEDLWDNSTPGSGAPDGIPDDELGCDNGNFGGAIFQRFDPAYCAAAVTAGMDARVQSVAPGAPSHAELFARAGVACYQLRVTNTGPAAERVLLDPDRFIGGGAHAFYGYPYGDRSALTPSAGRARPSDLHGLIDLGPLGQNASTDFWMFFRNADPGPFAWSGALLVELSETCGNGADDDCDGIIDNSCGTFAAGSDCYDTTDCASGICGGATDIVSLSGRAAVNGHTALVDDAHGICEPRCGDDQIEGDEECDGSAGCDGSCVLAPGYEFIERGGYRSLVNRTLVPKRMLQLASGLVIVGFSGQEASDSDWFLMRVTEAGEYDPVFGNNGFSSRIEFDTSDPGQHMACLLELSGGELAAVGPADDGTAIGLATWSPLGLGAWSQTWPLLGSVAGCALGPDDSILVVSTTDGDVRLTMFEVDGSVGRYRPAQSWGAAQVPYGGNITTPTAAQIADNDGVGETSQGAVNLATNAPTTLDGKTLEIAVDSEDGASFQTVTFNAADDTEAEILARINGALTGAGAKVGGGNGLVIESTNVAAHLRSIMVVGGTALAELGLTALEDVLFRANDSFAIDGTTFEFDKTASVSGANVPVDISGASSSAQVAAAVASAINGAGLGLAAHARSNDVELHNTASGAVGVSDNVLHQTFEITAPAIGGSVIAASTTTAVGVASFVTGPAPGSFDKYLLVTNAGGAIHVDAISSSGAVTSGTSTAGSALVGSVAATPTHISFATTTGGAMADSTPGAIVARAFTGDARAAHVDHKGELIVCGDDSAGAGGNFKVSRNGPWNAAGDYILAGVDSCGALAQTGSGEVVSAGTEGSSLLIKVLRQNP